MFDEMKRKTRKNVSTLMREAMRHYSPYVKAAAIPGQ